jgi:O-antigen ligase
MGLFLTLLYILTAYLGPQTLWGPLVEYHIEFIIAAFAMIASIPSMQSSGVSRLVQSYALMGMCVVVFLSFVFNSLGSLSLQASLDFLPNAFTFFLIVLNCKKKGHLQAIVAVLVFASFFTIARGFIAIQTNNVASPYLIYQGNDEGGAIYRLRGLSFINDPNDFSQLMVSLIPCLFFFWGKGRSFRNTLFVILPTIILLYGMFLSHSRGAIIAFLAVVIIAARRKIGTIPSLIMAGILFVISLVIGWSGGREISVGSGSDRLEAWSTGLELIKHHPIFGVGFQRFSEYFEITAHNSIVVCAAELGMVGLFFWVLFVLPTLRDAVILNAGNKDEATETEEDTPYTRSLGFRSRTTDNPPLQPKPAPAPAPAMAYAHAAPEGRTSHAAHLTKTAVPYFAQQDEETGTLSDADIRRMGRVMLIALTGYLVAGWFLSRAYVMTLFIYGGMVEVVYQMALDHQLAPPRATFPRLIRLSAITAVALLLVVYIMLRIQHMLPH